MDNQAVPPAQRSSSGILWVLTIPGYVMMLSVILLFGGAMRHCNVNGCRNGPLNGAFDPLLTVLDNIAITSAISTAYLIGLIPMGFSLIYPFVHLARRGP
jgi:hypothetical protein